MGIDYLRQPTHSFDGVVKFKPCNLIYGKIPLWHPSLLNDSASIMQEFKDELSM